MAAAILMLGFLAFIIFVFARQGYKEAGQPVGPPPKSADELGIKMESGVRNVGIYDTISDENYSGTTGDIEWTLLSSTTRHKTVNHGSDWRYTTRWRSASVTFPKNKYLMLMSTPKHDNSKAQTQRSGVWGSVVNRLAEGAIDIYVSGYFGHEYTSMINVEGATKIDIPELKEFFILTNEEALSRKFFSDIAIKYITNWMTSKPQFEWGSSVSRFGVLFGPDSTIISCQGKMANAEEAKAFSDFGASLATLMKEAIMVDAVKG